jgi:pilus assembly protein CpaF
MFGKRSGSVSTQAAVSRVGSVSAAPESPRPAAVQTAPVLTERRSETYFQTKSMIFGALIEAIDLSALSKLDPESAREEIRDIVHEIVTIKNLVLSMAEQGVGQRRARIRSA